MHVVNGVAEKVLETTSIQVLDSKMSSSVRVRIYRKSDLEAVRRLFRTCMMTGEGTPARAHLAITVRSPSFLCAFALLVISVAVEVATFTTFQSVSYVFRDKGAVIWAAAITLLALLYICYSIYSAIGFYIQFCLTCLRTDLKDIESHYTLRPVRSASKSLGDSEDPELEPIGIKAFWVAEIVSPATNKAEIVGCLSLADPPVTFISEPGLAELCRMVVSHQHRRRGIAAALIQACEAHAIANDHRLSAIVLRTTFYQPHARQLYAKLGYRVVMEKNLRFGNATVPVFLYRKDLSTSR
ncbi:hypothetical protein J3R30DRAFT_3693321 [Lentinula aciculospora]|uniref:N-acetyltransferase domain-containing protein n=1 Tax=Lentinula aciculospora TaxID=153920 RepID=A0A9W9DX01_9AGAR|nr:hypothetical protein J3R30DRAFT_3693321 [Lentinula aciculospora]